MIDNLYLHVGSHKTGTSAIQKFLDLNSSHLKEKFSLEYFKPNPWPIPFKKDKVPSVSVNTEGFFRLEDSECSSVVVSHENYSWITSKKDIEKIYSSLKKVAKNVYVVIYVRRQDRLAISQKQEGTKWLDNSVAYGHELSALPSKLSYHAKKYLDFNNKIKLWEEVFGQNNMVVRVFDTCYLKEGDAVKDFLEILGVSDISELKPVGRVNESISIDQQLILHQTRPYFPEGSLKKDLFVKFVLGEKRSRNDKLLPSKEEAEKFYARFKEGNKELNDRYCLTQNPFLFDDDFSFYPKVDNSYCPSQEFLIERFSGFVDHILESRVDKKEVSHKLRDLALRVEGDSLEAALEIMEMASEMNSEGPFIKKKIRQYKGLLSNGR